MRTSAWLVATLLGTLTVVAVACSDATGPGENAQRVARHLDSLWAEASSQAAHSHGYAVRAGALTALETPVAYGADPVDISVRTAAGTEQWKGVIVTSVSGASAQPVSLLMYRESDAHTILLVAIRPDGDASATMITNDSVLVLATAGSGTAATRSLDRDCTSAPGLTNPGVGLPNPARFTCRVGRFASQLSLIFPSAAGMDPALRSVFVAETTLNGVEVAELTGH
jgi:hypothetical protein